MRLEQEYGITDVSLQNARVLHGKFGAPVRIELHFNKGEYETRCTYKREGEVYYHIFNGFAWGYKGSGPMGLKQFLYLCETQVGVFIDLLGGEQYHVEGLQGEGCSSRWVFRGSP